jgi:hypothetical protein
MGDLRPLELYYKNKCRHLFDKFTGFTSHRTCICNIDNILSTSRPVLAPCTKFNKQFFVLILGYVSIPKLVKWAHSSALNSWQYISNNFPPRVSRTCVTVINHQIVSLEMYRLRHFWSLRVTFGHFLDSVKSLFPLLFCFGKNGVTNQKQVFLTKSLE